MCKGRIAASAVNPNSLSQSKVYKAIAYRTSFPLPVPTGELLTTPMSQHMTVRYCCLLATANSNMQRVHQCMTGGTTPPPSLVPHFGHRLVCAWCRVDINSSMLQGRMLGLNTKMQANCQECHKSKATPWTPVSASTDSAGQLHCGSHHPKPQVCLPR